MSQKDLVGLDERVVDYSDPAQLPHEPKPRTQRKDTGEFVAAGVFAGMLIVGGFVYAGYATSNPAPQIQGKHVQLNSSPTVTIAGK